MTEPTPAPDPAPRSAPAPTAGRRRVNFPASAAYPHRSTAPLRSKVLAVLGVLKVASTNQVWRLAVPHHKRPGKAYEALRDLVENKLVEQRGTTTARPGALPRPPGAKRAGDGETIWGLTDLGLAAAATVLPDHWHRGSRAREAGRATGSPHAMDVNETITAFTTGGLDATGPIGTIRDWHTHLSHELPGGRRQIADAVLQAPDHDVPLLLVEVDRHHETPTELAAKFAGYWEFFHLTYKQRPRPGDSADWRDDDPELLPLWRRQYPHARPETLPPVALVLTGTGELATDNLATKVRDLTEHYWQPDRHDPFDFTDSIPIVMARLDELQTDGPHGTIWWRYGNNERQSLTHALAGREYVTAHPRPPQGPGRRRPGRQRPFRGQFQYEARIRAAHASSSPPARASTAQVNSRGDHQGGGPAGPPHRGTRRCRSRKAATRR